MSKKIQLSIGAAIIIAILAGVGYQSIESTVYFRTPSEILANPQDFQEKTIRIGALVKTGSTQWDPNKVRLSFSVTEDNEHFIPVEFEGVKPDMFREGQGVVVEGRMGPGNVFMATTLLVKHNEEYQVDQTARLDKEAAYRSIINK